MLEVHVYLVLIAAHFVGDFPLQSHWMASNKSKDAGALIAHVGVYSLVILAAGLLLFGLGGFLFAAVNAAAHLVTDRVTAPLTARLWGQGRWHDFFVVVGIDQAVHHATLIGTAWLLFGRPL